MLAINIAENLQRESLNSIERGKAFRRLMQLEKLSARDVALRMHLSDATVSRELSLLELPERLQLMVITGDLPASVACHIVRLDDDLMRQELVDKYASGQLSRDGVAAAVGKARPKAKKPKPQRISGKLDGIAYSVTSAKRLSPAGLQVVVDALTKEIRRMEAAKPAESAPPLMAN